MTGGAAGSRTTSLVIVAFHRPTSLARLLERVAGSHLEITVVNVEADLEVSEVAAAGGAKVIDVTDNVGYAAAVNVGAAASSAPVVVFMNDDVGIDPADVDRLAGAVAAGGLDVAVPRVLDPAGRVERTIAALPTPGRLFLEWALLPDRPIPGLRRVLPVQKWREPGAPERIDAAAAVAVAVSRPLLSDLPLPEAYFLYWEESEWFFWLRQRGHVVEYRPDATVEHAGGRDDVRPDKCALLARNAVRCVRRTQGRGRGATALAVVLLWQLRLLALAVVRRRHVGARYAGLRAALSAWRELR